MWKMKDNEQIILFFIFHIGVNHLYPSQHFRHMIALRAILSSFQEEQKANGVANRKGAAQSVVADVNKRGETFFCNDAFWSRRYWRSNTIAEITVSFVHVTDICRIHAKGFKPRIMRHDFYHSSTLEPVFSRYDRSKHHEVACLQHHPRFLCHEMS